MARAKKSTAQRLDERAYSVTIPKAKAQISSMYNGDKMGKEYNHYFRKLFKLLL